MKRSNSLISIKVFIKYFIIFFFVFTNTNFCSWPALTNVQAWTETTQSSHYVYYKVYDPANESWIEDHINFSKGYGCAISNLEVNNGVVTWKVANRTLKYPNGVWKYRVYAVVYDPDKGNWQVYKSTSTEGSIAGPYSNNGIVAYTTSVKTMPDPFGYYSKTLHYTFYDPVKHYWYSKYYSLGDKSPSVSKPIIEDGMLAYSIYKVNTVLNTRSYTVYYVLYNPLKNKWLSGYKRGSSNFSQLAINDHTIYFTLDSKNYTLGFDYEKHRWIQEKTKPFAFFYASPVSGKLPLIVWLWNLSSGATNFIWDFGDGRQSTEKSGFCRYDKEGLYSLVLSAGSTLDVDTFSVRIKAGNPKFVISGGVSYPTGEGIEGVKLNGLPNSPETDSSGFYRDTVDCEWSGIVTPTKNNILFMPSSTEYTSVASSFTTNYIGTVTTDVKENSEFIPDYYFLSPNYPNPFNPSTTFLYNLPKSSDVKLEIFDVMGRKIKTLINQKKNAGFHSVVWYGDDENNTKVASGIYFYNIIADEFSCTRKMILLR